MKVLQLVYILLSKTIAENITKKALKANRIKVIPPVRPVRKFVLFSQFTKDNIM